MKKVFGYLFLIISFFTILSCSPENTPHSAYKDGLHFVLMSDGTYQVEGIERDFVKNLIIPSLINGKDVTVISKNAFQYWNMESVDIPDTIVAIGDNAFNNCENLKSIETPGSVEVIGSNAFKNCSSLTSVTLSEGLKVVNFGAFSHLGTMDGVDVLIIPESVETIKSYAFYSYFKSIYIPKNVSYIGFSGILSKRVDGPANSVAIYCEHESEPEEWDEKWARDGYGNIFHESVNWAATLGDL